MSERYLGRGRGSRGGIAFGFDASTAAWEVADFQAFVPTVQIPGAFVFTVDQLVREPEEGVIRMPRGV